jgi:hypothetical protein
VGRLFDAVQEIDRECAVRGLDPAKVKGEIGMKAGFFLMIVFPTTPDDPDKLEKLRAATQVVLGIPLTA